MLFMRLPFVILCEQFAIMPSNALRMTYEYIPPAEICLLSCGYIPFDASFCINTINRFVNLLVTEQYGWDDPHAHVCVHYTIHTPVKRHTLQSIKCIELPFHLWLMIFSARATIRTKINNNQIMIVFHQEHQPAYMAVMTVECVCSCPRMMNLFRSLG